jgi:acyl-CoA synthetase (AMP-forming)/AMP-acid ligase II
VTAAHLEHAANLMGHSPPGIEAQVVGPDDSPVPDGEPGEVRLRGPRVADGYLDDPQATAERFRDGWFYTRDIARRLPAGHPLAGALVMEGRADDRMNLGGIKVMPSVLEDAAFECPGVYDAAAFAVPDAQGLDECWLAVAGAADFERDSLVRHLAAIPGLPEHRFAWIDEIPRNAMGKVDRNRLRDAVIAARDG